MTSRSLRFLESPFSSRLDLSKDKAPEVKDDITPTSTHFSDILNNLWEFETSEDFSILASCSAVKRQSRRVVSPHEATSDLQDDTTEPAPDVCISFDDENHAELDELSMAYEVASVLLSDSDSDCSTLGAPEEITVDTSLESNEFDFTTEPETRRSVTSSFYPSRGSQVPASNPRSSQAIDVQAFVLSILNNRPNLDEGRPQPDESPPSIHRLDGVANMGHKPSQFFHRLRRRIRRGVAISRMDSL